MKIAAVIAKLEKQQQELSEIIAALRELDQAGPVGTADLTWDENEKRLLAEALRRAEGNQTEAARLLKLSRDKVRYKIAKHRLKGGFGG